MNLQQWLESTAPIEDRVGERSTYRKKLRVTDSIQICDNGCNKSLVRGPPNASDQLEGKQAVPGGRKL